MLVYRAGIASLLKFWKLHTHPYY